MTTDDPVVSNGDHYRVVFENDLVRVLEYGDLPGESTTPHVHPNTVMVTLTSFERRLRTPAGERHVALDAGRAVWLPAQRHSGEKIGSTPTRTVLVELKGDAAGEVDEGELGPVI